MQGLGMAVTFILKSQPQIPRQYQRHHHCREAQPAPPFQLKGRDLGWLRKTDHQDRACPYSYQVKKTLLQHLPPNQTGWGKENRAEGGAS